MRQHFLLTIIASVCFTALSAQTSTQILHSDWTFRQARGFNRYSATVPGTVHSDLMACGIIDDPFFRLNERGVQWIDKEDWIYETVFDVDTTLLNKNNIILRFEGLDTYADVSLNGEKILQADNMFRTWTADVKPILRNDSNRLEVFFHSPVKITLPMWEALPFHYHASNDQSENGGLLDRQLSVFARKAGYHFGWDWGPRLVTSGIWRPVTLEGWNRAKIENVYYCQKQVEKQKATFDALVEIVADSDMKASLNIGCQLSDPQSPKAKPDATQQQIQLRKGLNRLTVPFEVKNPQLWWTNGLGKPTLYDFTTTVSANGNPIDADTTRFGIRTLRVVEHPDQYGSTFYFELNGTPVFMKGANYIPQDNFLTRVSDSAYARTIDDAVAANMNMLRVWGGGIYENDLFYDLCDERGILVWQDFMFACSMYPATGKWLDNVRAEAVENVRRLRNHPSIAIWAGNNECMDAWLYWGWKREIEQQNPAYADTVWTQYLTQYHEILSEIVKTEQPDVCYRPSCPYTDERATRTNTVGDMHYWSVWQGLEPLSAFNTQRARFFSEYGFQSFPEFESVKRYAPRPEDWSVTSEVMMSHQRGGMTANTRILKFLEDEYRLPKDFPSFTYLSQLLQGDAMKTAMESHRRNMPFCMGSLVWQHNDCWPVASWSSRDYYGRWKAQHWFTVKAFAPLLVSPVVENGKLRIFLVSDRLTKTTGRLTVELVDLNGGIIDSLTVAAEAPANGSAAVWEKTVEQIVKSRSWDDVIVHVEFHATDGASATNNCFLHRHKTLHYAIPDIETGIAATVDGFDLTLTADRFARGVFVSIGGRDEWISDNYMDLLPGRPVTVRVKTNLPLDEFKRELSVKSFVDAF
jgi:beta-mannosidase